MERLAEDVFHLPLLPRNGLNVYVLGDVLVDAGISTSPKKIVRAVNDGHPVATHVLTHAHGDHIGGTPGVVDRLGVPVWCGADDADAAESGRQVVADTFARPLVKAMAKWKPVPVARRLQEGDEVGPGFTVLHVPGHSPGHIALWREADRALVCGDVFINMNLITTAVGLHEPPGIFTPDFAANRASARRLAALEPELVMFGHGPPLRDPAKLKAFADALPA
jgi:hydroxyacylglutathione hydrolase